MWDLQMDQEVELACYIGDPSCPTADGTRALQVRRVGAVHRVTADNSHGNTEICTRVDTAVYS